MFACALFGGVAINANLRRGLESFSGRLGADILVVPKGYDKTTQAVLLRGEPASFYMKSAVYDAVRTVKGVEKATPQYFISSFDDDCCDEKVQIIGFDPASDFILPPWLPHPRPEVGNDELVVGSRIFGDPGETLTFYGRQYRIAAKLAPTGLGLDTSIFMPIPGVIDILKRIPSLLPGTDDPTGFISSVAVKVSPDASPEEVATNILRYHGREYSLNLLEAGRLVTDISNSLRKLGLTVYGAAAALWLLAVTVLSTVFSLTLAERRRELGILRILGASRGWIVRLAVYEAAYTGLAGALLGLALAGVVVFPFSTLIFLEIGLPHLSFSVASIIGYGLVTLLVSGATGALAGALAAWRLTGSDAYRTLREGE
ncbi:hypothetical protein SDC9_138026 [bioreactor metagenome]|uniref:Uncharacterized protein n=1 Tax=bioreactor metagenome TaxID=1076179 RepID=A0A645DQB1_9ZZZZ